MQIDLQGWRLTSVLDDPVWNIFLTEVYTEDFKLFLNDPRYGFPGLFSKDVWTEETGPFYLWGIQSSWKCFLMSSSSPSSLHYCVASNN